MQQGRQAKRFEIEVEANLTLWKRRCINLDVRVHSASLRTWQVKGGCASSHRRIFLPETDCFLPSPYRKQCGVNAALCKRSSKMKWLFWWVEKHNPYRPVMFVYRAVVANRGREHASPGDVNKFPVGASFYSLLQHGRFDQQIYHNYIGVLQLI